MANSKNKKTAAAKKSAANNKKTTTKKTAAKKTSSSRPAKAEEEKKKALQGEVLSIVLIGLSLIMFICVLSSKSMGAFGELVSSFLIHSFGIGAAALPIVLLVFSIQTLFSKQKGNFKIKLLLFLGFFAVFISLAHIMTRKELADAAIPQYINYYYQYASLSNGGVVGAVTGGALHSLIGTIGSYILLLTALIVLLILATGKSFVGFINYIGDVIDGVKEEYNDYRENTVYEEETVDEPDKAEEAESSLKRKPKKILQQDDDQQKLPLEEMEAPKNKKIKAAKAGNQAPSSAGRVKTFNLLEEDERKDEDVIFQNDFILENNKLYFKPKRKDIKFTGLGELVDEADKIRAESGEHYVFQLPEDDINIENRYEEAEENRSEIAAAEEKQKEGLNNSGTEIIEEDLPDIPPWETPKDNTHIDDNDKTARAALKSINTPAYRSGEEPVIIEAEKTKTLNRLKVNRNTEYNFPKIDFLGKNTRLNTASSKHEMYEKARQLEKTLHIFHVDAKVNNISQGPAVTRYELTPPQGVSVKKIVNLDNDIALSMAARSIRIEAPIPGKSAIGIEIPNDTISMVYFREVLTNEKFQNFKGKLAFGIGKDITGNVIVQDIAKMPHLLIAGSTGSGKSVCINTLITSILYKYNPDEVKLIMVDPKIVELGVYNGIPHLLIPVVTDPQKAAGALNWAVREMMRRYDLFADLGVRNLEGYNNDLEIEEKLPQIIVIIDELADLMMVAKKDVESSIQRLTQLARAAGIHLVIATQRPSVNVITGIIKANVPSRIAFKVASAVDSRTILDASGAEKLLGKGDMLFQAGDMDKPLRIQGAFVTDKEVEKIVSYIKVSDDEHYDQSIINEINASAGSDDSDDLSSSENDGDDIINDVISFVVRNGRASTSLVQRKFRIGFNRAARIIDELEERGIVGPDKGGTKGRDVLMDKYQLEEWKSRREDY